MLRVGKGAGIFFEPYTNDYVYDVIKAFGMRINYNGQLSFDAVIDATKEVYFIEYNPRGTSGGHLINKRLSDSF